MGDGVYVAAHNSKWGGVSSPYPRGFTSVRTGVSAWATYLPAAQSNEM